MADNIENSQLNIAVTEALVERRKEETKEFLVDQVKLMKIAADKMDISNLRLGPYTATLLSKIDLCKEALEINGENFPEKKVKKITKLLEDCKKTVDKKMKYGVKISKYLEKKMIVL